MSSTLALSVVSKSARDELDALRTGLGLLKAEVASFNASSVSKGAASGINVTAVEGTLKQIEMMLSAHEMRMEGMEKAAIQRRETQRANAAKKELADAAKAQKSKEDILAKGVAAEAALAKASAQRATPADALALTNVSGARAAEMSALKAQDALLAKQDAQQLARAQQRFDRELAAIFRLAAQEEAQRLRQSAADEARILRKEKAQWAADTRTFEREMAYAAKVANEEIRQKQKAEAAKAALVASASKASSDTSFGPSRQDMWRLQDIATIRKTREEAARLSQEMKGQTHTARELHSAMRGLSGGLGLLWITYGSFLPLVAGAALTASLAKSVSMFSQLEYQLQFVVSLSDNTVQSFSDITTAVLDMSKAMGVGPVEAAKGMRVLAQTGLSVRESLMMLPEVMRLATVGELSMDDASRALVGTMNAFGQTLGDVGHIADVMSKAGAISQTSVAAMTESFRTASTVADEFGMSVEEAGVGLVLLAKRNIIGQAAGTSLMNMMTTLTAPTKHAAQIMKQLGVSAYDSAGQIKPLLTIMGDFRKVLSQYDKESQVGIMKAITNNRGWKEFSAMINESDESLQRLLGDLKDSGGFTLKVFNELLETTTGQFNLLKATMESTFANAGGAGEQAMIVAMRELRNVLADPAVQEGLAAIVRGVAEIAKATAQTASTTVQEFKAIGDAIDWLDKQVQDTTGKSLPAFAYGLKAIPGFATAIELWEVYKAVKADTTAMEQQASRMESLAGASKDYITRLQDETTNLRLRTQAIYDGVAAQDLAASVESSKRKSSRTTELAALNAEEAQLSASRWLPNADTAGAEQRLQKIFVAKETLNKQAREEAKAEKLYAAERAANAAAVKAQALEERKALEAGGLTQGGKKLNVHDMGSAGEADRMSRAQATDALAAFRQAEKAAKEQERHALALLQIKRDARQISNEQFLSESDAARVQRDAAIDAAAADAQKRVNALKGEKASTQQQLDTAKKAIAEERAFQLTTSANKKIEDRTKLDAEISKEMEKQDDLRAKMLVGDEFSLRVAAQKLAAEQQSAVVQAGIQATLQVEQRYLSEIERLTLRISELQEDGQDVDPVKVRGLQDKLRLLEKQRDVQAGIARKVAEDQADFRRSAGFGLSEALRKYEDEATNTASHIERIMTGAFKGMEDALVNFVMTGKFEFKDFARSVIADMARMSAQASLNPILKGVIGFATNALVGAFGGGAAPVELGGWTAGLASAHTGGIVGEIPATRSVSPALFFGAQRFHGGGIVGDEVPIIAQRGERVLTKEQQKQMGGNTVVVNVTVNSDGSGSKSDAQSGFGAQLARNVKSVVLQTIAEEKRSGGSLAGVR